MKRNATTVYLTRVEMSSYLTTRTLTIPVGCKPHSFTIFGVITVLVAPVSHMAKNVFAVGAGLIFGSKALEIFVSVTNTLLRVSLFAVKAFSFICLVRFAGIVLF